MQIEDNIRDDFRATASFPQFFFPMNLRDKIYVDKNSVVS